jgi:hypothetical protein
LAPTRGTKLLRRTCYLDFTRVRYVDSEIRIFCYPAVVMGVALTIANVSGEPKPLAHESLKSPSDFQSIPDQAERSRAIFTEIGRLITHPRYMNCHPVGDLPLQGADHHEHRPRVFRSDGDHLTTNCGNVIQNKTSRCTKLPPTKAFPGTRVGASRPCRWRGRTNRSAKSAAN